MRARGKDIQVAEGGGHLPGARWGGTPVTTPAVGLLHSLLTVAMLGLGCAGAPITPQPVEPAPDRCLLLPASEAPATRIRLALTEVIAPRHAPVAANDSERLLFRQLYEGLVELDCEGKVIPGLAGSWAAGDSRRTWILTLRDGASFWDGTRVTAQDVISGWQTTAEHSTLPIDPARAVALDESTLRVELPEEAGLSMLAHPDLAVARRDPGRAWPEGTGAFRIEERPGPAGGRLGVAAVSTRGGPEIQLDSGTDPRDLLDAGADFLTTRDPLAIDYAAALPAYRSRPLPWDRTYVLLSPESSPALGRGTLEDLARNAVRGEARAPEGPHWWNEMAACQPGGVAVVAPGSRPRTTIPGPANRLVYPRTDRRAGELAERLVSVIGSSAGNPPPSRFLGPGVVAMGLAPDALSAALRERYEAGYLLPLERRPLDPCRQTRALLDRAPWLAQRLAHPPLTALVETRALAIAGTGMSAIWVDGLGAPLLSPPRRRTEASSE